MYLAPNIFVIAYYLYEGKTEEIDHSSNCKVVQFYLFFCRCQHRDDWQANGFHRQSWTPVIAEDRETNMSVAINVRMDGYRIIGLAHESNNGRVKGVSGIEFETKTECLALIKRSWWSFNIHDPSRQIYASVYAYSTRRRQDLEFFQLNLKSFLSRK